MLEQTDTKVVVVDKNVERLESCAQIVDGAKLLREGEIVAFPTETVYGLGANALSDQAVAKIYQAKGRPSDNPLIVHIADLTQLKQVVREVSERANRLIEAFWPGPLTLIMPKSAQVADLVTAGLDTVGVRMPDHPVALALIKQANVPVAAPSANRSGKPSPTTAEHVRTDLNGRIPYLIDGGTAGIGVESTVLDVTVEPPLILRPGGITAEQIAAVIGEVRLDPALQADAGETPRAPGMKYTHYAPGGDMWLVEGEADKVAVKMKELLEQAKSNGLKTGVLVPEEFASIWEAEPCADIVISCGSLQHLETVAQNLYASLRMFDEFQVQSIISMTVPKTGIGITIMNRMEKAAGGQVIRV
ncbi:L-threonylcarbamoyladenylate synthase [Brevibacillus fulvus]|uniref:Threonylcarbamoyl-AMP synthase n=1 Tax=Brevibacillus fulvus TaxID=1125967 RepID=A0A938XU82_9BACL|nr:L-threonylcarbamoyladenylate synthase [Brevibacillus fulvus]MBM7590197.1 L-threonylcarbamoyladenylate synthase [Brevibacillus fulvus]